jgi:cytochrome c-type biogenesis protein CcsB
MDGIPTNLSLSFCYHRPIINIENKNLFKKVNDDRQLPAPFYAESTTEKRRELKREFSKNKKNLTYKIAKNLDNLSYRILGIGFPFLTIGILSGSVWANEAWGSYWSWDPKETWALLTWLVFAIYFHSRLIKGWEGKKPAILATLGFIVVWICFIGVNLLKSGLHSYGFFS